MQGFIRQPSRDIVLESGDPRELIDKLEIYSPPTSIIKVHKLAIAPSSLQNAQEQDEPRFSEELWFSGSCSRFLPEEKP